MRLTIVVPRTESDQRVADILQRYASAGFVRPFILLRLPDEGTWVDDSGKTEYANFNNLLAEVEGCDLIRFICFSTSTDPVDSEYAKVVSTLRQSMNHIDIETSFGGAYLCASDEVPPSELFSDHNRYFNYNLVVLPEDSLGEVNSPTLMLKAANRRDEVMANMLAVVGALWWWLDEAPLDGMQHAGEGDLQRVRLAKVTARMTQSKDLVTEAINNVLGGDGKRLLPRECVAHGQPEMAISELHHVLTRSDAVSPIGFSYRPYRKAAPSARKALSIIGALRLFFGELMTELHHVPRTVVEGMKNSVRRRVRRIEEKVEDMVSDQTFGRDSKIMVGVRDTNDVYLVMDQAARCRELDQIPDLGNYRAVSTPRVWTALLNSVISAADGGDYPAPLKWDGLEWHERRAVIEDLRLIAPDLRNTKTLSGIRAHDVQSIRAVLASSDE